MDHLDVRVNPSVVASLRERWGIVMVTGFTELQDIAEACLICVGKILQTIRIIRKLDQPFSCIDSLAICTNPFDSSTGPLAPCTDPFATWTDLFAIWTDSFAVWTDLFSPNRSMCNLDRFIRTNDRCICNFDRFIRNLERATGNFD